MTAPLLDHDGAEWGHSPQLRAPRTIDEYRRHLHEEHGAPATSSIDHRTLSSLQAFHGAEHTVGYGPKWAAFVPHSHRGMDDPTAED